MTAPPRYKDPKWHLADVVAGISLFLLVLWVSVPTSFFYRPTAVSIQGYEVTVSRTFPLSPPFNPPIIKYVEIVRPLDGGQPCVDRNEFRYRLTQGKTATWNIGAWAAPCVDGEGSAIWSARWQVKIFGIIPLRPVELEQIVPEPTIVGRDRK